MNNRVLAIIVCYNPVKEQVAASVSALMEQLCDVILIDNGSQNTVELRDIVGIADGPKSTSCQLIELGRNLGLGAAHNIGIRHAQELTYDYVLIMDQDSLPLSNMVANLVAANVQKTADGDKVSATGVTYLNEFNGSESFFIRFGGLKFQRHYCRGNENLIEADFLISSGSLISVDSLTAIGLMEESLFIDHVDTEWFLRAHAKGYKAYGVCNARMEHGLGEKTHELNLGGRKRNVPQHKPFRYYYIFRNSVLLYKRPYPSGLWKWNDMQRLGMIFIMFGLLKSPRMTNLSMMIKGVWDGLRGKTGKFEDV
jgi:rhamnosyltransferase